MENIVQGQWFRGPSADLGTPIDQSLRFRALHQSLSKTPSSSSSRTTWTWSGWLKKGKNASGTDLDIFGAASSGHASDPAISYLYFRGNDEIAFFNYWSSTSQADLRTTAQFRDNNAWMHIVLAVDTTISSPSSDRIKLYVNGVQITDFATAQYPAQNLQLYINDNVEHKIGEEPVRDRYDYDGYMAEVHFVDGTQLAASDFGRFNNDGVWVPQNYTGTYGTNGFHLTFDSSQTNGIGHDSSGNDHHFTASGFDTADVRQYSSGLFTVSDDPSQSNAYLTATGTAWTAGTPANFFDGAGTEVRATQNAVLRFDPAIPNVTQIQTVTERLGTTNWFNGTSQTSSSVDNSFNTIYTGSAINLTSIVFSSDASLGTNYKQIRVTTNGTQVELIDNTDNDVDYNDTPTNNYTTLNPLLARSASITFENANLRAQYGAGGSHPGMATQGFTGGKYYWEVTPKVQVEMDIGIVSEDYDLENDNQIFGETANGWAWRNSATSHHNGITVDPSHTAYGVDDTVGIYVDADAGTAEIEVNGVAQSSSEFTNIPTDKRIYPFFRLGGGSGDANFEINFGQMNFVHDPGSDWKNLATNNLPEPTIKNGKEYFEAITYTGTGVDSHAITGLDFQPDLVWIKPRSVADNHRIMDSIRGVSTHLIPNSTGAEPASNAQVLESFDSGGFTLDGTDAGWNGNTSTYVAWCWKAGTSYTPTVTGFTSPSASINTEAGFGIYTFTGNNVASSFTHGLDSTPELIIAKNRTTSSDWVVFGPTGSSKTPTPTDTYLRLNEATDANKGGTQILTGNTSTTVSVASFGETAGSDDYVYYLWHSVEGFSKFGQYAGHSNSHLDINGAFVYCGFKPRWVMIKAITRAEPWMIFDSELNAHNPSNIHLRANETSTSTTYGEGIDIVSNGFKVRAGASIGEAANDFLYMAFAEHPFGGKNQPPATAR